jgi:hypothetical protein
VKEFLTFLIFIEGCDWHLIFNIVAYVANSWVEISIYHKYCMIDNEMTPL